MTNPETLRPPNTKNEENLTGKKDDLTPKKRRRPNPKNKTTQSQLGIIRFLRLGHKIANPQFD